MFWFRSIVSDQDAEPRKPHADPEVEALLHFPPVVRKCVRHDGWLHERQVEFIIALTILGHAEQAAQAAGGTLSGAYKLRTANGGEGFAAAWDSALALHLRRNPRPDPKGRPSRGEIESGTGRKAWPAPPPPPVPEPEEEAREQEEMLDNILVTYLMKVSAEREARLSGRIVEADLYVRQLSWFEVVIDLAGRGPELLMRLRRGDLHPGKIVATPMSLLLARARRKIWELHGEPERPPEPQLGRHDDEIATGPPLESQRTDPHLSDSEWRRRQAEKQALAAEAQRAWEEKARAESEEWRKRESGSDAPEAEGEAGER
ncbi:MAG TPA: hypothetical protein VGA98_05085 [Allosphingosinicella sp.]|jgi:hypothetical protein